MKVNLQFRHWLSICLFLLPIVFFGCGNDSPLGLEQELESTRNELNSVRSELSSTQSQLSRTESELADVKNELEESQTDLSDSHIEISDLEWDLEITADELIACQDYGYGVLKIQNNYVSSITKLYLSPSTSPSWGGQWLGSSMPSITYRHFGLKAGRYDIRTIFGNGKELTGERTIIGGQLTTFTIN